MKKNLSAHQQKAIAEAKALARRVETIKRLFLQGRYTVAQFDNDTRKILYSIIEKLEHVENNDGIH